jgi:hypothetical protein
MTDREKIEILEKALVDAFMEFEAESRFVDQLCHKLSTACEQMDGPARVYELLRATTGEAQDTFVRTAMSDDGGKTMVLGSLAKMYAIRILCAPDPPESLASAWPVHFLRATIKRVMQYRFLTEHIPGLKEKMGTAKAQETCFFKHLVDDEETRRRTMMWVFDECKDLGRTDCDGPTVGVINPTELSILKEVWQEERKAVGDVP